MPLNLKRVLQPRLFFASILVLLSANLPHPQPVIPFETYEVFDYRNLEYTPEELLTEGPPQKLDYGRFPLLLNLNATEIEAYIKKAGPPIEGIGSPRYRGYTFQTKTLNAQFTLLEVEHIMTSREAEPLLERNMAFYLLQDKRSVGVIILDAVEIYLPRELPFFQAILKLPKDKSKLKQALPHIPVKEVSLYEVARQDQWRERYAVMHLRLPEDDLINHYLLSNDYLMMQAFYPKMLSELVEPLITQYLKENIEYLGARHSPQVKALNQRTPFEPNRSK